MEGGLLRAFVSSRAQAHLEHAVSPLQVVKWRSLDSADTLHHTMRGGEEDALKQSAVNKALLRIGIAILMAVLSLEGAFLAFTLFVGFPSHSQAPHTEPVFFLLWSGEQEGGVPVQAAGGDSAG